MDKDGRLQVVADISWKLLMSAEDVRGSGEPLVKVMRPQIIPKTIMASSRLLCHGVVFSRCKMFFSVFNIVLTEFGWYRDDHHGYEQMSVVQLLHVA